MSTRPPSLRKALVLRLIGEWLRERARADPEQEVGRAKEVGCCPIAQYLRSLDFDRPKVTATYVDAYRHIERTGGAHYSCAETPRAVRRFIERVDEGAYLGQRVRAATALEFWEEVVGETP